MKKLVFFFVMAVFAVGTAWAGPPENGELASSEAELQAPSFEVSFAGSKTVKFLFPIRADQTDLAESPDIQVYASYAYSKNGRWVLAEQDSFAMDTDQSTEGQAPAYIGFPDQGTGWFWVRTWAKDKESGNWIWVNEGSDYCRDDREGRPGYEFLVNFQTGEIMPVPESYETRD
jgi:hypothetical protein